MKQTQSEILINAHQVTHESSGKTYEFVLDENLCVIECVRVDSIRHGLISHIEDLTFELKDLLFELNHVRVNPRLDNTVVVTRLTQAFHEIGVGVHDIPTANSMKVCYKPLGEISDNIRFYINSLDGNLVFLSPAIRPRLVSSNR